MECNKEEAIIAKNMAEKKMQLKDFLGARKTILRAQKLFPDLENIAQMLTVCDVHCAEAVKVNNQVDWYGILQVEPTADENSIKKQYRRLAFLLHPDKNKFEGAECAFKLVGEAQRMLLDKSKRSVYDSKRNNIARAATAMPPPRATTSSYATAYGSIPNHQQSFNPSQTFWTSCPFCRIRYQYYNNIMKKLVRCQSCSHCFIAYDMNVKDMHIHAPNQSGFPLGNEFSSITRNKVSSTTSTAPGPWLRSRVSSGDLGGTSAKVTTPESKSHDIKEKEIKYEKVNLDKVNSNVQVEKTCRSSKRKRAKETVGSISEDEDGNFSVSSDSDTETVNLSNGYVNVDTGSKENPRRSTRKKPNVIYSEDQSDDEAYVTSSQPKRSRRGKFSKYTVISDTEIDCNVSHDKANSTNLEKKPVSDTFQVDKKSGVNSREGDGVVSEGTSDSIEEDTTDLSYPDPEFYDFGNDREANVFSVGQFWALYDETDGMPRYYVRISGILNQNFKVQFSWLEYHPQGRFEKEWSSADLPVGCGGFHIGETETAENLAIFSHVINVESTKKKNKFNIYPRRGQVWALFAGWDIKWVSDPKKRKCYDYELVEIIAESSDRIDVARLFKVKGFVSLFAQRLHYNKFHIPRSEMLRFSHMIPYHKMSGNEGKGVPVGSYELDPAALPLNFEEFSVASFHDIGEKAYDSKLNGSEARSFIGESSATELKTRMETPGASISEAFHSEGNKDSSV